MKQVKCSGFGVKEEDSPSLNIKYLINCGLVAAMPAQAQAQAACERALLQRLQGAERAEELWGALRPTPGDLPIDPRQWSRRDVGRWALGGGARAERFPMNGKALCLMTRDMFTAREPSRGPALYQDFRRRLAKALALQELLEKLMAN